MARKVTEGPVRNKERTKIGCLEGLVRQYLNNDYWKMNPDEIGDIDV